MDEYPSKIHKWPVSNTKRSSTLSHIRKRQTTVWEHFIPIRIETIERTGNNKYWRVYGKIGTHTELMGM